MELQDALARLLDRRTEEDRTIEKEQHEQFLSQFPRAAWSNMPLEHYALGTENSRESYSYALEWGTPRLGSIRGGSAHKHVIFKRNSGEWKYPSGYASAEEAWNDVRSAFLSLLSAADEGRWEDTAEIDLLRGAKTVRLKTLFLYFPENVLPVYSHAHLSEFAQALGLDNSDDPLVINRRILTHLRQTPGLTHASTHDLGALLYEWKPPTGWHTPSYWKIAPGPNAAKWDDCLSEGYICVGWDDVGDLSLFDTEEEFRNAFAATFQEAYKGHQSTVSRKANELWRLTQLESGDKIVANNGQRHVLAIGTVTDTGYEWRPERSDYKHTVAVEWDTSFARELAEPVKQWATTTVLKVPKALVSRLTDRDDAQPIASTVWSIDVDTEARYREWAKVLDRKKQLIFYGPPGTGKTHAARGFARWLLTERLDLLDEDEPWSADELDATLRAPAVATNAWWVTANPDKWSWDELFRDGFVDFTRGRIQKHYDTAQSGDVVVCYQTAPESRVVGLARIVNVHPDDSSETDLGPLRLIPIQRFADGPSWSSMKENQTLAGSEPVKSLAQGTLFSLTNNEFREILRLSGTTDDWLGRVADDLTPFLTDITFHASYSYEEFIEGYRPIGTGGPGLSLSLRDGLMKRIARTAAADTPSPYVLLIDELNRANLPRVFGELLTVLEADKRGSGVILPASGESMAIPENLFIIGTMNTADRSIRSLDAALRRRFAFVEILPDPSLLEGETVDELALDIFLMELNRRITATAGRERQIGHSYFLSEGRAITSLDEFAEVVRLEIIPLLQEIAYDDFGKLAEYLGNELVDAHEQRLTTVADNPTSLIAALAKEYQAQPANVDR